MAFFLGQEIGETVKRGVAKDMEPYHEDDGDDDEDDDEDDEAGAESHHEKGAFALGEFLLLSGAAAGVPDLQSVGRSRSRH
ncbi:hypothetical protein AAC387_Pa09g1099 [Persea americana]